jgi:hypothetical protein
MKSLQITAEEKEEIAQFLQQGFYDPKLKEFKEMADHMASLHWTPAIINVKDDLSITFNVDYSFKV